MIILIACIVCLIHHSSAVTITATGASFPDGAFQALSFGFENEVENAKLQYFPLTSTKGRCRLLGYSSNCPLSDTTLPHHIDWISTTGPVPDSDYNTANDLHLYPAFAGAVVPIYNLGPTIKNLVLSRSVLSKMFRQCLPTAVCPSGWIEYWNDTQITDLNPHIAKHVFDNAGKIKLVVWADKAGTTETFKKSLALFDNDFQIQFANQINDGVVWPNVSYTKANTNRGVSSRVLNTYGSIGYVSLDEAVNSKLPHAAFGLSFLQSEGYLYATADSTSSGLVEKGLQFGNIPTDPDPERLTADAYGATGSEAWPMVQFVYFGVRNNTVRSGSTCAERNATMKWFEWFYTSETAGTLLSSLGFAPLPLPARKQLLAKIRASFKCEGILVFNEDLEVKVAKKTLPQVNVQVDEVLFGPISLFKDAFKQTEIAEVDVEIEFDVSETHEIVFVQRTQARRLILDKVIERALPYAAGSLGIVYNLCDSRLQVPCNPSTVGPANLIVSVEIIALILKGEITMWNDPRILDIQQTLAQRNALPNAEIKVFLPDITKDYFEDWLFILNEHENVNITLNEIQTNTGFTFVASIRDAQSMVAATEFSLTFSPVDSRADPTVFRVARMLSGTGEILIPNATVNTACFPVSGAVDVDSSNAYNCWPLVDRYYVVVLQEFTTAECLTRNPQSLLAFVEHCYDDSTVLSLFAMTPLAFDESKKLLNSFSCFGRSILSPTIDMQYIPWEMIMAARVFYSLLLVAYFVIIAWTIARRKNLTLIFLMQVHLGSLVQIAAVFPLTIVEPEVTNEVRLDRSCMVTPWLYFLGIGITFAPLLARSWKVRTIFNNPTLIIQKRYENLRFQFLFLLPVIILLICWTIIDPYSYSRIVSGVDQVTGETISTIGICSSQNLGVWLLPIISYYGFWLLFGLFLAISNRKASGQYVLVRNLTFSILVMAEALLLGVPLILLTETNPVASFVVKLMLISLTAISITVFLFGPIFLSLTGWASWFESRSNNSNHKTNTNNLVSPTQVANASHGGAKSSNHEGSYVDIASKTSIISRKE